MARTLNIMGLSLIYKLALVNGKFSIFYPIKPENYHCREKEVDANNIMFSFPIWIVTTQ